MGELPTDPFKGVAAMAVALHEQFAAFKEAGFTEEQAFSLVQTCYQAIVSISTAAQLGGHTP